MCIMMNILSGQARNTSHVRYTFLTPNKGNATTIIIGSRQPRIIIRGFLSLYYIKLEFLAAHAACCPNSTCFCRSECELRLPERYAICYIVFRNDCDTHATARDNFRINIDFNRNPFLYCKCTRIEPSLSLEISKLTF